MTTDLRRRFAVLAVAVAALAVLAGASLCVGARSVPPGTVWAALTGHTATDLEAIVRDVRVPRTVLACCAGAALATAGTLIQTLTRNPLAEPGVLGVTAGAAFAITLGTVAGLSGSQPARMALAVAGSALAAAAVYAVGRSFPLRLLLAGVALTAVLAGLTLGLRLVYPDALDEYRYWSVGSLAGRERTPLALPLAAILLALAGTALVTRPLGGLMLGDGVAHALGARVRRTRVAVLVLVTLLTGAATAVVGPVMFVGLIVPHLARRLAAGSLPWLAAYTAVLGSVLLVAADIGARLLLPTGEVPVAIVTAFLGGPALIWVVRRHGAVAL
ncbi:FecCD family ABC transporter permease [Actinomadura litoris]|uniref:Iron chelate uptake ABC transporter family permease subunit n=1 Tax=Actinomadura litoris TaxID=2678616 RepID=A0A7K1LC92_9ACTN|nr:iron chelate uptake ABC transporter family permease subunit [Actinomadura litoris]MUN41805.1 iron chelate uptake ABC transporter family permease subunit [Actinomadura litoris]